MRTQLARSYIKIYGPPILKAIRALENLAVEFSKTTTIRHYNILTPQLPYGAMGTGDVGPYERVLLPEVRIPTDQKVKLISRSSESLGEYDFFFEWASEPTKSEVQELIGKIDEALASCGCRYTIVTR